MIFFNKTIITKIGKAEGSKPGRIDVNHRFRMRAAVGVGVGVGSGFKFPAELIQNLKRKKKRWFSCQPSLANKYGFRKHGTLTLFKKEKRK